MKASRCRYGVAPIRHRRRAGRGRPLGQVGGQRRQLVRQLAEPPLADPPLGPLERVAQPIVRERLQHVVDGLHVEGARRVLAERRHEDDCRPGVVDHLGDADAGHLRHLDVEEEDVRPVLGDQLGHLARIAAFDDRGDVGVGLDERADHPPRQRFVVDDQDAEAGHAEARARSAGGSGGRSSDHERAAARRRGHAQRGRAAVEVLQARADVREAGAGVPCQLEAGRYAGAVVANRDAEAAGGHRRAQRPAGSDRPCRRCRGGRRSRRSAAAGTRAPGSRRSTDRWRRRRRADRRTAPAAARCSPW